MLDRWARKTYLCPAVTRNVVKDYWHRVPGSDQTAFSVLTVHEREVLQLMAEGKSIKQIAKLLHTSAKAMETHRQQLAHKLLMGA